MLDQSIATVRKVLTLYENSAKANPANQNFANTAAELRLVVQDLEEQRRLAVPVTRQLGDISDLPEELIKELSLPAMDEEETQILAVMRACEGKDANIDQLLVGMFRKFKAVMKRRYLQSKLYRMAKKGLLYQVTGQRGYFTLTPPESEAEPELDINVEDLWDVDTETEAKESDDEIAF